MAGVAVITASALFATVRRRRMFADPRISPYEPPEQNTYIYSVWHDSLLMPLFFGRQSHTVALVGPHQDGGVLASAMQRLKIPVVRGSSSRGGAEAVHRLLAGHEGHHIVVTPDGPRGPRREMKPGVAFLSSHTGKPVVPTAFVCRRSWSVGAGWTDLAIPKPWTTVYAFAGEGIRVPAEADKQTIRHYTEKIQQEMDRLDSLATDVAAGRIDPEISLPLNDFSRTESRSVEECNRAG